MIQLRNNFSLTWLQVETKLPGRTVLWLFVAISILIIFVLGFGIGYGSGRNSDGSGDRTPFYYFISNTSESCPALTAERLLTPVGEGQSFEGEYSRLIGRHDIILNSDWLTQHYTYFWLVQVWVCTCSVRVTTHPSPSVSSAGGDPGARSWSGATSLSASQLSLSPQSTGPGCLMPGMIKIGWHNIILDSDWLIQCKT